VPPEAGRLRFVAHRGAWETPSLLVDRPA
jgi:hypothetical protein